MSKIDLEVKEFIKKAETDSNLKASIERTMGINWYSKALFQMLGRKYGLWDFTQLSRKFCQITQIPLDIAINIGKKVSVNYSLIMRYYIACEGYAVIISGKRKVINNE